MLKSIDFCLKNIGDGKMRSHGRGFLESLIIKRPCAALVDITKVRNIRQRLWKNSLVLKPLSTPHVLGQQREG